MHQPPFWINPRQHQRSNSSNTSTSPSAAAPLTVSNSAANQELQNSGGSGGGPSSISSSGGVTNSSNSITSSSTSIHNSTGINSSTGINNSAGISKNSSNSSLTFTKINRTNNSADSLFNNTLINLSSPPRNTKHLHAPATSSDHSSLFNEVLTPIPVVRSINTSNSSLFNSNDNDPLDFLETNTLSVSPSKGGKSSPNVISPPTTPPIPSPGGGSPSNRVSEVQSRPPNRPPPPLPARSNPNTPISSPNTQTAPAIISNNNNSPNTSTTTTSTAITSKKPEKAHHTPSNQTEPEGSSNWFGMSFKFFKKRFTSGIGDKEPKWDLRKSNSQVLKVEDRQTVSYLSSQSGPKGIARANISFSSSFSYFELFITNGKEKICFGLASGDHPSDVFPGFTQGSYGYSGDGKLYLGSSEGKNYGPSFVSGDVVGCGYDSSTKSLFFTKNGTYLGVAAKKVNLSGLFPTVGLQSSGESVIINFLPPFSYRGHTTEKHSTTTTQTQVVEELIPKEELESCRWDNARCGRVITVSDRTATITSDSKTADIGVVQSTHPLQDGFCYFEVLIKSMDRGHVSVGLAGKEYPLNLHIGWVKRSYGYHSDDGRKFKWREHTTSAGINEGEPYGPGFKKGDIIGCGLFFETREIFFTKNGTFLGVAFNHVYGMLYPSVAFNEPGISVVATFSPPFKFSQGQNPSILLPSTSSTPGSQSNLPLSRNSYNGSGSISNSNSFNNSNSEQNNMLGSKSMPSLASQHEHNMPPPQRVSPPHSLTLPPSASSISTLSSFSSQCVSLPATNSSSTSTVLTSSLASLSFSSLSPPSSPKTSPRKILSSSDEVGFVPPFQDGDGAPPSAWRRCGKSLKMKDDITIMMIKKKTAVAQANRPFSSTSTLCYFEVYIEGHDRKGTVTVGLTQATYPFNRHVGREPRSYGYSSEGDKYGGSGEIGEKFGPAFSSPETGKYTAPGTDFTVIGCGINNTTREIFFTRNGVYLGVAFWNVPTIPLYPSLSMRSVVGGVAVATFSAPFKFNFEALPGTSPSIWTESLGPDRGNQGFRGWPPNDVAIWLDAIGYSQYRKNFRDNNISGRHLPLFNHTVLKNELGIEPLGHRADILNRVSRMIDIWKDYPGAIKGSNDSIGESMDSEDNFKKSVRWSPDDESEMNDGISSSQKLMRPTKSYNSKVMDSNIRRSTFSGGESKRDRKLGLSDSSGIEKSGDSISPIEQDDKQASKTLSGEQLRYLLHNKRSDDPFDLPSMVPLPNNNSLFHTFSPRPSPHNSNPKNTSPTTPYRLPPIVNQGGLLLPTSPHPSFLMPNGPNELSSSPSKYGSSGRFMEHQISHSGGIPNTITSTTTSSSNNHWDDSSFPNWESSGSSHEQQTRREYEIDFGELEFGPVLGKGFFGEVKRGYWRETDVAIKIIYRDQFKTKTSFEMFQNEVSILSKLRHPNVVQFLGACTSGSEEHHCIVIEWMGGGSLRQFLIDHFQILEQNPHLRLKIALDIAKGMCYLHGWTPPILHRDLSSRNILLDNCVDTTNNSRGTYKMTDFKCKISDFGLSRLKMEQGTMTASVGCIPYMAPEVFKGDSNSEKSDVYSYAMILWELLTSEEPQQDMKPMKMAHLAAYESYRPPIPLTTSHKWKELLTMCWDSDLDKRPTFKQVIAHLKEMEEQGISSFAPIPVSNFDTGVYA
eukprot:gene16658-19795_t